MFGSSPLGSQIAEARRQDDFARATAHRQALDADLDAPAATPASNKSIRFRIGAAVIALGQRVSGVELCRFDGPAESAIPGVR